MVLLFGGFAIRISTPWLCFRLSLLALEFPVVVLCSARIALEALQDLEDVSFVAFDHLLLFLVFEGLENEVGEGQLHFELIKLNDELQMPWHLRNRHPRDLNRDMLEHAPRRLVLRNDIPPFEESSRFNREIPSLEHPTE